METLFYEETGRNIPLSIALVTLKHYHILSYYYDLPECAQVALRYLESVDRVYCNCNDNRFSRCTECQNIITSREIITISRIIVNILTRLIISLIN